MNPQELSVELRTETDPCLRNRRRVAALSLGAASAMGLIALYQIGAIRRLPDLPGRCLCAAFDQMPIEPRSAARRRDLFLRALGR